jgi:putative transposase
VDTEGRLTTAVVHAADIPDRVGARRVLARARAKLARLAHVWTDGAYTGDVVDWAAADLDLRLECVSKPPDIVGSVVLPRRWVVERTLGWFGRYRRLSKDYEEQVDTSQTWLYVAMTHILVRRLARGLTWH